MRFPPEIPWPCLAGTTNHFNWIAVWVAGQCASASLKPRMS